MSSVYEQTVTLKSGEEVNIYIKKPNNAILNKAERHKAKAWNDAFKDGVLTKKEVHQMMVDRGIWDDTKADKERKLTAKILDLEKQLYRGDGKNKPKLSDGRKLAVEMRDTRIQLRDLIAERIGMDENTVEALSDNAKFDYLVACCTFYKETDKPVFESYAEYSKKSADEISVAAAQLLAKMIYQLDQNFEDNLPENVFLKRFNLIDEEGNLVDPNNEDSFVDAHGRKINELGHYLDEEGNRVDIVGDPLDSEGFYDLVDYEDDLTEEPEKKPARKKTVRRKRQTKPKETSPAE